MHLGITGIEHGAVVLADGSCRAVVEVGGIDLGQRGPGEQEASLAGFAAFLNALAFPVQILVRLVPVDLEPVASRLEDRALRLLEEPLAGLALDHAAFLRRLGRRRPLVQRRFYVVVPGEGESAPADQEALPLLRLVGRLLGRRRPAGPGGTSASPAPDAPRTGPGAARPRLAARCSDVVRHLGRCDLRARRLGDAELAGLFYACWCPELARVQPLPRSLAGPTAPVVRVA